MQGFLDGKGGIGLAKKNLKSAKENKVDEFYTQIEDIEKEIINYKDDFSGKTVLCNCDDPYESNFFKYFALNFNYFGLKKLIATCYSSSPIMGKQLSIFDLYDEEGNLREEPVTRAYKIEITEVKGGKGSYNLYDVEYLIKNKKNILTMLKGNGDFKSDECVELLKEADIVCTNPPFSLFREYVALLEEYDKKYIIIGNTNALTYREIFKLIKEDRIRTGYTNFNVGMYFFVPDNYTKYHKIKDGRKMVRVSTSCWFTNLEVKKHKEKLIPYKHYNDTDYPKYFNYDAINVNRVTDIPVDWDGEMGVPITFIDKYNPEQFEVIGLGISNSGLEIGVKPYTEEHKKYRKEVQKRGAVDGDLYMLKDGVVDVPYARVIIRKRA